MRSIPENSKSILSDKIIGKMMRLAKIIAEDNNPCYSRKVGSVIVDRDGIILGTGFNGPPRKTPHCDSASYIRDILWPKLNQLERAKLASIAHQKECNQEEDFEAEKIALRLHGCGQCPRRLLQYSSGIKTELCSCQHAERNCIVNSNSSVRNGILFGYCNVSCFQCTGAIINAGISEVHFLDGAEYDIGSIELYRYAQIPLFLHLSGN